MKILFSRTLGGIVLLLLLAFVWVSWRNYGEQATTDATMPVEQIAVGVPGAVAAQQESPLPTATPTPIPTLAVWATPELPPIAWSAPPACENHPQSVAEWQEKVRSESMTLSFQRLQRLSPALQKLGSASELADRFLQDPGTDEAQGLTQDLLGLWLNVINGQINRATEIGVEGLPDAKTVGMLIDRAEQDGLEPEMQKTVRLAIDDVLTGKAIVNPVCANRLIMQLNGEDLQSQLWSKRGVANSTIEVKKQITADGWVPGLFQISPDYQKLAIESYSNEGGGPIYLLDLKSRSLINLNSALDAGMANSSNVLPFRQRDLWQIIGWHPDSHHLLLGIQGQTSVIWVDTNALTFEQIDLYSESLIVDADDSYIALLPSGDGFVYAGIANDGFSEAGLVNPKIQLVRVDFASKSSQVLFQSEQQNASIHYPRISPTGASIAFLVEQGVSAATMSYSLQLLDIATGAVTVLVKSDYLGRSEPVWSPSGNQIAFTWSTEKLHGYYPLFPELEGWIGNLWVISVQDRQLQQVTFLEGAAKRPAWSLDGATLMFFTHNGQYGATKLNGDRTIWSITESSDAPIYYGSLVELP